MNDSIQFVYFDVGGVLLHFRGALKNLADETGVPHAEFERILRKYDNDICVNAMSVHELWQKFVEELQIDKGPEFNYLDYLTSHYTKIGETHALVYDVAKYYRVGLLTNTYEGMFVVAQAKGFIPDVLYAVVIESCKERVIKPDPQIYARALAAANVSPEHILLIDDMEKNVAAARENRWQAYLFNEHDPQASVAELRRMLL